MSQSLENRVLARYLQAKGYTSVDWIIDEIIRQKTMKTKIDNFLHMIIREGQEVSDYFRNSLDVAERIVDHEGLTITERDAIQAVYKGAVEDIFDDALGPLLADLIATRKYVD